MAEVHPLITRAVSKAHLAWRDACDGSPCAERAIAACIRGAELESIDPRQASGAVVFEWGFKQLRFLGYIVEDERT